MRKLVSRAGLAVAVAMLLTALIAPPASADTVYLQVWWIRCDDQSEPFSDEIRLRFNGFFVAGWDDVDGGETHAYWSSRYYGQPINLPFSGNLALDIMESDGAVHLIGYLPISESEVGTGPHERAANMYDGRYTVRYEVTANPV